jgi:hypothetical protein
MQTARGFEDVVRDRQRTAAPRSISDNNRDELVIAESGGPEAEEFLARTIVRRQGFYGQAILTVMSRSPASVLFAAILCASFLSVACATPPTREMDQAQGAIDAARAAGAERFAAVEFTAAVDALKRSEDAVAASDYRLALNHALDSRERAQNAAKIAVNARADARGQAERAIAEVATLITRAQTQLKDPDVARLNAKPLRGPRQTIATAEHSLQEARAALAREDYEAVAKSLNGAAAQLQAALSQIDAAISPAAPRRKR